MWISSEVILIKVCEVIWCWVVSLTPQSDLMHHIRVYLNKNLDVLDENFEVLVC